LIQGNFVINWYGAGIALVNGTEVDNMLEGNFVTEISGTGERQNNGDDSLEGNGYWEKEPDNSLVDNVATDINPGGTYSYGFDINAEYVDQNGLAIVPAFQGADPTQPGQSIVVNMWATPILQFSGNETYGATPNGMQFWWLGTFGDTPEGSAGTVQNFYVWNEWQWGYFGYETNDLTIDGFFDRTNPNLLDSADAGMWFADYEQTGLVIDNADIQGENSGITGPAKANGETLIENSYFSDVTDVSDVTTGCVSGASGLPNKSLVLQSDSFGAPSGYSLNAVNMDFDPNGGVSGNIECNLTTLDQVFVYNYDQTSGDNFQVYYTQQAASAIMLQTGYYYGLLASPVSGLTNQQNWSTYGIATAGAVAPTNATTMTGIDGLVVPVSGSPPDVIVAPSSPSPSGSSAPAGNGMSSTAVPPPSGLLAQSQISGAPSSVDPSTSTPLAIALPATKSAVKSGTSRSTTRGLIAGPLALIVPSRNRPVQTPTSSRMSPQTAWDI
jgi:hypothetical protein